MIYNDAFHLVASMQEHRQRSGENLRCFDDPMRRVVGFRAGDSLWEITLTGLKTSMVADPSRAALLRELFLTPDGRERLAESINQGQSLV